MNIKEAKEEIKHTLLAYNRKDAAGRYTFPKLRQRPILLMGPPGIGKTAIMEQVAEECEVGLVAYTITHHTRQSAVGLPRIVTRCYNGKEVSITEYTLSEIIASVYDCMERTGKKEGILFIDEINCVSETLAPTMLQFLQNKTFGSHSVPEGWLIAAAGNPPEYNKSVREFDIVTLDRVRRMDIEADLGRVRSADPALRFGPRAIDVDLLLFGQIGSENPHCLVPHPRLTQRAFALVPLLDVAPHAVIDGLPATEWLARLQYKKEGQRIFQ